MIDIKNAFWDKIYKTKKTSRATAYEVVQDFYYRCRQRPSPQNMWSDFYANKFGKYIHGHTSKFLVDAQNNFCVYCYERIFHKANANIEHILPRRHYPQFTFSLENLVVICITCNAIKGDKDYHKLDMNGVDYDAYKLALTCYHPKYHKFNEHINLFCMQTNMIYVRTYVGTSVEGKEFCNSHLNNITAYYNKKAANPNGAAELERLGLLLANSEKPNEAAWDMLRLLIEKL